MSTCVWLKHKPTGIDVKCHKERSQSMNRFLARRMLVNKIETKNWVQLIPFFYYYIRVYIQGEVMFAEEKIIEILKGAIPGAVVEVSDMTGTKDHFQVLVTSSAFEGKSLIEQHQMVMQPLKEHIADDTIHALSIKTKTK